MKKGGEENSYRVFCFFRLNVLGVSINRIKSKSFRVGIVSFLTSCQVNVIAIRPLWAMLTRLFGRITCNLTSV